MPHTMQIELITPKIADQMLATMVKNRPVSESKILEYAVAMDEGEWALNGETIKIDQFGHLIDGQHRLRACVLAEKNFRSFVARGIEDPEAFATIDVGKTRTARDVFGIAGYANPNVVSGAALIIYGHKHGLMTWKSMEGSRRAKRGGKASPRITDKLRQMPGRSSVVPKDELLEFSRPIADGLNSAVRAVHTTTMRKAQKLVPVSIMAALYYLFREKSFDDAERFFYDLGEGVGLTKGDPVYWLRERLLDNKSGNTSMNRYTIIGLCIKAWNKRREGEETKYLKIGDGEEFPKKIK